MPKKLYIVHFSVAYGGGVVGVVAETEKEVRTFTKQRVFKERVREAIFIWPWEGDYLDFRNEGTDVIRVFDVDQSLKTGVAFFYMFRE